MTKKAYAVYSVDDESSSMWNMGHSNLECVMLHKEVADAFVTTKMAEYSKTHVSWSTEEVDLYE